MRWVLFLFLFTSAFAPFIPALAEDAAISLPGSAIVFPKFIKGSVVVDGGTSPATEIPIHVRCPLELNDTCSADEQVRLRFHWICPGSQSLQSSFICQGTGFEATVRMNGTILITPDNLTIPGGNTVAARPAPCPRGYLIAYVINEVGHPIKFDALDGIETLRESGAAESLVLGIAIPAAPGSDQRPSDQRFPLDLGPGNSLVFDGVAGHYAKLTSRVRQNFPLTLSYASPAGSVTASIIMLTLDVRSNRPNLPTFVDFENFDQGGRLLGISTQFLCWTEQRLNTIGSSLTFEQTDSRWELAFSGQAVKFPLFGISDKPGPVTLMGLMQVVEGPPTARRTLIFGLSPVFAPTPTSFRP